MLVILLFAAILFHPHSSLQAPSESVPLVNAASGGNRALTECGGGWVETTEQRWSLKVRCERDVAEQALSLGYTAGSVTDCSPAPLLSLRFYTFHHSHSDVSAFSPLHLSPSLSVFISFYIPPYCLSFSRLLPRKSLLPLPDTAVSIHHKAWSWNTKLGSMMHYETL